MALATHSEVWNWPTYYEDSTPAPQSFQYDPTFYARLETWVNFFYINTPSGWWNPGRLYSIGVYVAGSPPMHSLGRGFDLSRINMTWNGATATVCDMRTVPTTALWLDRYWGAAASLHYHFAHVITWPYGGGHNNHIHVDNQVSGSGNPVFNTSSRTQTLFVQHSLFYVWGYTAVSKDGAYGPQTADYASRALDRSGAAGSLTSQANWQRFCTTTTRFGTGTQSY